MAKTLLKINQIKDAIVSVESELETKRDREILAAGIIQAISGDPILDKIFHDYLAIYIFNKKEAKKALMMGVTVASQKINKNKN